MIGIICERHGTVHQPTVTIPFDYLEDNMRGGEGEGKGREDEGRS